MERTTTRMNVRIDANLCEGHGRCYMLAPSVFGADVDGRGEVIVEQLDSPELLSAADLAVRSCPESAISVSVAPNSSD